jgi:hypothetical protein
MSAFAITFFKDHSANAKTEERLTLQALADRIRRAVAPAKDRLPWLKCARFGNLPTARNSLRWDGNLVGLSGIVVDYDSEKITLEAAAEKLDKVGITALVYASPSSLVDGHGPRWRAVCPFTRELSPEQHYQMVARLNGLFGGTLALESFTLSQAYYFGSVSGTPTRATIIVNGLQYLDQADELDESAVGKSNGSGGIGGAEPQASIEDIRAALAIIPNPVPSWGPNASWIEWNTFGMAIWRAAGGSEEGRAEFDKWSRQSPKYDSDETEFRWRHYSDSPPSNIGFGSLVHWAREIQPGWVPPSKPAAPVSLDDFYAYMPSHGYIYIPSRDMWPGGSVNARIPPIAIGVDKDRKEKFISAAAWLDRNRPVEQMTWSPGDPTIIKDRLVSLGGWIERSHVSVFNLYRPALIKPGIAAKAEPWLNHLRKVYPDDANHIIDWLAHRVQRPHEKVNHALLFGGVPNIGKDTILEPVKRAVGPWNFLDVSPKQAMGRFNGFLKSVILRISEARDLGDFDRFQFYEHIKTYTASPPDMLRIDEKNLREYYILNCCGVIITTNYKTDGIHLPADDRRHYVTWSDAKAEDFEPDYWPALYRWYDHGGSEHVAAYLAAVDLRNFNAKAPPPKTDAFWEIVNSSRAPENAELADAVELLGNPDILTISEVISRASESFAEWLNERKNSRRIPHRLEDCGYVAVRNKDRKDGLWRIRGKRQAIYAKSSMTPRERIAAAIKASGGS